MEPLKRCVKEAKLPLRPILEICPPQEFGLGSSELGRGMIVCNKPDCPLGFEYFLEANGLSNGTLVQPRANENVESENSLESGNEAINSLGVTIDSSLDLVENVP